MFQLRENKSEWMDSPAIESAELNQALKDIQWVNRHLGGTSAIVNELFQHFSESVDFQTVLDIGTGSGDIPVALAQKARNTGHRLQIVAIDNSPVAVAAAKKEAADYPEIDVFQKDALALPYKNQSFDWVISSMFMHHLKDSDVIFLLKEMARLARKGFIINDLERHPCAYWSVKLLGHLTGKGAVFLNDAPLSVLKGFTFQELGLLCAKSELTSIEIKRKLPFRLLLTWNRPYEPEHHYMWG